MLMSAGGVDLAGHLLETQLAAVGGPVIDRMSANGLSKRVLLADDKGIQNGDARHSRA